MMPYLTTKMRYAPSSTSCVKLPLALMVSVLPLRETLAMRNGFCMRRRGTLRRRRIWLQVHVADGEDVVVVVRAEFEWVVTRHFEIFIKNLLVGTKEGKRAGCGKSRKQERQKSGGKLHFW